MTIATGSAAIGAVSPTARRSKSDGVSAIVLLHAMAAELVAQRGKEPFGERVRLARPEPREERRGQNRHRHGTLDGFVQRPAAFAGILDVCFEISELRIFGERASDQLQQ